MRIERLDYKHKDLLHEKLRGLNSDVSEYSFSNLYLFRETHQYKVVFDESIFISGITYNGQRHIMPTTDITSMDIDYIKKILKNYDILYPIPEEWTSIFNKESFECSFEDSDSDYIHHIKKLESYSGKKLHQKRNLLNQFLNLYSSKAFPLAGERLNDAALILESWMNELEINSGETDYEQCLEAIKLYDELILCGGIYYADNEPAGFIIGEEINDTTFAIHFAKAKRKFKGIYQFMFNNFAKIMPDKYCCLNFEQDLGKESLRQAKSTYRPETMIKKYRIKIRA